MGLMFQDSFTLKLCIGVYKPTDFLIAVLLRNSAQ